jgi:O-antigen ligase
MADLVLPRAQLQKAVRVRAGALPGHAEPILNTDTTKWIIRYIFYAFIFSVPFESAYLMGGTTLSRLFGLALAAFALLQPRLCYAFPPRAFWWFAVYLLICVLWGSYLMLVPPDVLEFNRSFIKLVFRLTQLLVLFWISYNLLKQERVCTGALWALAGGTVLLAMLQILGITGDVSTDGRVAAFEDENPNNLAFTIALGLLALFGLGYGREKHDWKGRLFFWLASGILAMAMVQTGARGAVVAVVGSLSVFFLRGKSFGTKLKFGAIALVGIVVLTVASYQIDAVRKRWEKTFYDQSLAGREKIYPAAIGMILESPLVGWGPINHKWELGPRVGERARDEHNLYLYLLAEVGLVGAIPFFAGLWFCWRAAWSGRHRMQGILPLVMSFYLLIGGLKGTPLATKLFWVVLSYALASSSHTIRPQRSQMAVPSMYSDSAIRGRSKRMPFSRTRRPTRRSRSSYPVRRS